MSKKFTEEQYHKIVEIGDEFEEKGGLGILDTLNKKTIGDRLFLTVLASEIEFQPNSGIIMAIANPLTREWAHEQFVEKEKKYVWRDKYTGYVIYKMLNDWSLSATALGEKHFTETELENSPFKPEWFEKEEVD